VTDDDDDEEEEEEEEKEEDDDDDDDDSLLRAVLFSLEQYTKRLAAPSAITSWAARRLLKHYRNLLVRVAQSGKQNYNNFDFKKLLIFKEV
jgi:TATA-binding protein-associated factor Taf7